MCGTGMGTDSRFIMEAWFLFSVYQDVGGFKASSSVHLYNQSRVETEATF